MARAIISKLAEIEAHEDYYLLIGIVVHQVHNILIKKQDNEKTRELVKGLGVYS